MNQTRATKLVASALLLGGALALGCGSEPRREESYNVLLISLDSTRYDILSTYGRKPKYAPERSTCPNLDRLAEEGLLFEEAYSTTSWTLPSHFSILTGQPEVVHAVELDGHVLDSRHPTLAEVLSEHGYRTAGFFSGPYLEPVFGFDRGFDRYEPSYGEELMAASKNASMAWEELAEAEAEGDPQAIKEAKRRKGRADGVVERLSHRDISSTIVTDGVLSELDAAADHGKPWFLFAHYFDPHYDYVPPPPHDTNFDAEYDGAIDGHDFMRNEAVWRIRPNGRAQRVINDRDLDHIFALYEGEMEWTDKQLGRIFDRLDELGMDDNTLVVVTADHGDEFFEHGGIGHRRTLFEEVVRVPLIVRLPKSLRQTGSVDGVVSTTQILSTVLDVVDLPRPTEVGARSLLELEDKGKRLGIFGRLVQTAARQVAVSSQQGSREVVADWLMVQETYRKGTIKITRARNWLRPRGELKDLELASFLNQSRQMFSSEALRWVDLAKTPGEQTEDFSTDFSDPEVRAVLQEFHDRYVHMLELRGSSELADARDEMAGFLQGLGYTGSGSSAIASDEFALPPPGRRVLGKD